MTNTKRTKTSRSALSRRDVAQMIMARQELKRFPLVNTANTNATAGVVQNLTNGIIQGDDISQRTGDQIRIVKHTLRVRATAITVSQTFRFIWFKDNTNRGSTPTVLEVLNTASHMSQYNPISLQQKRFTIFNDFVLNCSLTGESIKERVITRKGHVVNYNGATAVAASNGPHANFLLVIGDSLTGLYDIGYEAVYTDS